MFRSLFIPKYEEIKSSESEVKTLKTGGKKNVTFKKSQSKKIQTIHHEIDDKNATNRELFYEEVSRAKAALQKQGFHSFTLENIDQIIPIYNNEVGSLQYIAAEIDSDSFQTIQADLLDLMGKHPNPGLRFLWSVFASFEHILRTNYKKYQAAQSSATKVKLTEQTIDACHTQDVYKKRMQTLLTQCNKFITDYLADKKSVFSTKPNIFTTRENLSLSIPFLKKLHAYKESKSEDFELLEELKQQLFFANLSGVTNNSFIRNKIETQLKQYLQNQLVSPVRDLLNSQGIQSLSEENLSAVCQLEKKGNISKEFFYSTQLLRNSAGKEKLDYSFCDDYMLGNKTSQRLWLLNGLREAPDEEQEKLAMFFKRHR